MGNRHICVVFPGNIPLQPGFRAHSCAKTWGRLHVGVALSGVCSCFGFSPTFVTVSLRLFWAGRCRLLFSAPAMPGRVCEVVAFASRAFSQSKLTKCISSQAKISQRWKSCCRGSPGAVVSLTQQVPHVWLFLCLGRVLFFGMGGWW